MDPQLIGVIASGIGGVALTLIVQTIQARMAAKRAKEERINQGILDAIADLKEAHSTNSEAIAELRGLVSAFVPNPIPRERRIP